METEIIQQLMHLGLSSYEAKCYLACIKLGKTTGYQISKLSTVPRARIYDTLDKLIEKQIVSKIDVADQVYYVALPYQTFIARKRQEYDTTMNNLQTNLNTIDTVTPKDIVIKTYQNKKDILSKINDIISNAKHTLYVSLWPGTLENVKTMLNENDISIKGIVFDNQHGLKNEAHQIYIHRHTRYTHSITDKRWFIIINDQSEMIYGSDLAIHSQAYYSIDPQQIYLMQNFIWHDILVNQLVDVNPDADEWIDIKREQFFK
ncbi:TrmB family transcriptional regulator [Macrococcoides caseolyticum]|uniref:TrmB family transcriptional regulator n=1 Tax=Macrococcoides caseolyticum TaxID=69966 RepID=UPI001F48E98C|nr:TrmB family transcriptional regulator [Macrococcus caseolyticus]MCE4956339.1 TrmB family transcriptional regulator [Macrococcus caseolyticus]